MVKPKPSLPPSVSVQDAADWIEFQAIASHSKTIGFPRLTRMLENSDESGGTDFYDDDGKNADIVNNWISEIQTRIDILKDSYPFEIAAEEVKFLGTKEALEGRTSYLLCLILSHAANTDVIDGKQIFCIEGNDVGRKHFQTISTLASSGYLKGSSISFGWPRLDGSNFKEALERVVEEIFDGAGMRDEPSPAAPKTVKDFEIDIISWVPTNDNMPGKVIMVGQVASGADWNKKPLRSNVINDLDAWVHPHFGSRHNVAAGIFIPFCMETDTNKTTADCLHFLAGNSLDNIVFYRYRIPFYVNEVYEKNLVEQFGLLIDLEDGFADVSDWVSEKLSPLLTA